MACCVESLEGRTLFAVVGVPTSVLFAYDALVIDGRNLKASVAALKKAVATEQRTLTADVRAAGNAPDNVALLKTIRAAGNKAVATLSAATARYLAAANPAFRKVELAEAIFTSFPTSGTSKALAAAQAKLQSVQSKFYPALATAASSGTAPYSAAIAALAAANPDNGQIAIDVQSAANEQSTLSTTENALVTKVDADVSALLRAG